MEGGVNGQMNELMDPLMTLRLFRLEMQHIGLFKLISVDNGIYCAEKL